MQRFAPVPRAQPDFFYEWMTPDAPDLSKRWPGTRPPPDECPVLRLTDGTLLQPARDARRCRVPGSPNACTSSRVRHDHHRRRAGRASWRLPFTARPRACALWLWSARRPEARPGHPGASRTFSASQAAYQATNLRAARSSRQGGSERRYWLRARSLVSMRQRVRFASMATSPGAHNHSCYRRNVASPAMRA